MPPKIQTPSTKLKKIKMVIRGNINRWIKKVGNLIEQGADPKVLDNYRDNNSIITEYVLSDIDTDSLYTVIEYLLKVGVTPTNEVFVACLIHHPRHAALVMKASGNNINVNNLEIYDTPVHIWVAKEIIKNKKPTTQVQYLMLNGLKTTVNKLSINDLEVLMRTIHLS
jgi:hypothetical protein